MTREQKKKELEQRIKELEQQLEPKSCLGCKYGSTHKEYNTFKGQYVYTGWTNCSKLVAHRSGNHKNPSGFYCSLYEPKDKQ